MMPRWWLPASFKNEDVWAGLQDGPFSPMARVDGRVPFRYQATAGAKVYRTHAERLRILGDDAGGPRELPPGAWADDVQGRGPAHERRVDPDPEIARLRRELENAHRRIAELERLLRRRPRAVSAPADLPDLTELIGLCHPDRHPEARREVANRITAQLLELRRRR